MKRALSLALAAALAIGLVACGNGAPASGSQPASLADSSSEDPLFIDYGRGLTDDGYFADIDLGELVPLPDDYMKMSFPASEVQPSEADWEFYRSSVAASAGTKNEVDAAAVAEEGKYVSVDFSGSVNGEDFVGGSGTNVEILLGANVFLEDLEKGIIGHKSGDMFTVKVTFPEGYGSTETNDGTEVDLGGQVADFNVVLNSVYDYSLTDEQIAEYFATMNETAPDDEKVTDEASLKAYYEKNALLSNLQNAVLNQLDEEVQFEIPQTLIDDYVAVEQDIMEVSAYATGRELDEYLQLSGYADLDDFRETTAEQAKSALKNQCILLAIAQDQGIEFDADACVEAYGYDMENLMQMYQYPESYVRQNVLCYQALTTVTDAATVS